MKTIKNKWFALSSDVRALIQTILRTLFWIAVVIRIVTDNNALIIFTVICCLVIIVFLFRTTLEELKEKNRNKDEERKFNEWVKRQHRGH